MLEGAKPVHPEASIYATLYDLAVGFPAAVAEGTRSLTWGEIYDLDEGLIEELDEYEGFYPDNPEDSLYTREKVEARLPDGKTIEVETYLMPEDKLEQFFAVEIKKGEWHGSGEEEEPKKGKKEK